jgi:hypothetical protein
MTGQYVTPIDVPRLNTQKTASTHSFIHQNRYAGANNHNNNKSMLSNLAARRKESVESLLTIPS